MSKKFQQAELGPFFPEDRSVNFSLSKNKSGFQLDNQAGFPGWVVYLTLIIAAGPLCLVLLGFEFGGTLSPEGTPGDSRVWITHALLEWSSFGVAAFAALLAFIHYAMKRDKVSPVIGMTLLFAGCADAFQALAVNHLAEWIIDIQTYIPFTWTVSRFLSGLILIAGVGFLLSTRNQNYHKALPAVVITSLVLAFLAYGTIYITTITHTVPQTLFPESFLTRPWELGPLVVYVIGGVFLFPRFHKEEQNYISHSLMISVIPHAAAQLYMGFGSQILFDPYFQAAHFTKILAYLLPLSGLVIEILKTYQHERLIVESFGMIQKELRKLDGHNKLVLDSVGDGVVGLDAEGTTTSINPSAQLILGYTEEEFIGKPAHELIFPPNLEGKKLIQASIKYGRVYKETDGVFRRKNGTTFRVEYVTTPILENGRALGVVITFRESTERRMIEGYFYKALQEVSKAREEADSLRKSAESANKTKSLFLSVMSHEIRTPLSIILGYAQILQRDHSLDMNHRDAVRKIETSGNHLLELINDLLDISKIETGEVELALSDFDLHSLLLGLADMFRNQCEAKNIRFRLKGVSKNPIYVYGDERKLRQILVNLLGNAVKFTDEGEVTLTLDSQPDNKFRFTVSDTGNGIRTEDQVNIFELFKQGEEGLNKGGTGLGLAISWELSELMGGELSLESEVGQGSSFSLTLELAPASPVPSRSRRSRQVKELSRKFDLRVLVVDDSEENRVMLSEILRDIGAEVFAAGSGKKALEQLKKFMPDIIFMDMRMPVMSGEEATQKIIEHYGSGRFKIVGVTASTSVHDQDKMITAGCKRVITKPYRVEQIFKCIQELLGLEYEYQEVPDDRQENAEKAPSESKEMPDMCIPAKLFLEFKESIEQNDIPELEKLLEKLRTLGDEGLLVERHLRPLLKNGDFSGMLDFLENIPVVGVLHD